MGPASGRHPGQLAAALTLAVPPGGSPGALQGLTVFPETKPQPRFSTQPRGPWPPSDFLSGDLSPSRPVPATLALSCLQRLPLPLPDPLPPFPARPALSCHPMLSQHGPLSKETSPLVTLLRRPPLLPLPAVPPPSVKDRCLKLFIHSLFEHLSTLRERRLPRAGSSHLS